MKTIHFVLIAKGLTGDSEIHFFEEREKATDFFLDKITPLFKVCLKNEIDFDFFNNNEFRFDSGIDKELDALLNECNHYIKRGSVILEDGEDYFFAYFAEYVDDSGIDFYNKEKLEEVWSHEIFGMGHTNPIEAEVLENEAFFMTDDFSCTFRKGKITI